MQVIGLSGYARSGKDEAAKVLVEEFGFTRVAFADKLRDVLYALDPIVGLEWDYSGESDRVITSTLSEVFKYQNISWENYKETKYGNEIRRLLQRLGTEAGRQTLWDSIWVDAALTGHPEDARLVVTDCRFENEAQAVVDRGGEMWRIERLGNAPANAHASETSLDDWNFTYRIMNDGSLESYRNSVRACAEVTLERV